MVNGWVAWNYLQGKLHGLFKLHYIFTVDSVLVALLHYLLTEWYLFGSVFLTCEVYLVLLTSGPWSLT